MINSTLGESSTNAQDFLAAADSAYYAAEYDKAIDLYQKVLVLESDNQRAQQQLEKAQLNQVANTPPRQAVQLYRQARSFIAAKDFKGAITLLEAAVEEANAGGFNYPEASELLEKMQSLFAAVDYKEKADIEIREEKWEMALDHCGKAFAIDPSDEVNNMLRNGLQSLIRAEEMINSFEYKQSNIAEGKRILADIGLYINSVEKIITLQVEKIQNLANTIRYKNIISKYHELLKNHEQNRDDKDISFTNRLSAFRLFLNNQDDRATLGLDLIVQLIAENQKTYKLHDALIYMAKKHPDLKREILRKLKESEKKHSEMSTIIRKINKLTKESTRYDVFISYSHVDEDWVENVLLPTLENEWIYVCIDFRDFEVGAPSITEMERAAIESRKTILVLTPDYIGSEWAGFENLLVQSSDPAARQKRMIPILLRACNLPPRLKMINYLDFTRANRITFQFDRLLNAIKQNEE